MKSCCKKYWDLYIETDNRLAELELARIRYFTIPDSWVDELEHD
jgi:hypothetical protein